MLIGGFGYICPGPLTTVEIIGIAGVAASTAEQASSANSTTAAEILIALSLHPPPTTYHLPSTIYLQKTQPPIPPPRLHASHPAAEWIQRHDHDKPHRVDAG